MSAVEMRTGGTPAERLAIAEVVLHHAEAAGATEAEVLVNAEDWEPPVKNPGRMEDCQLTGAARRADHLGRRRPSREVLRSIAFLGVGPPGW